SRASRYFPISPARCPTQRSTGPYSNILAESRARSPLIRNAQSSASAPPRKELNAAFSQAKLLITPKNGERAGRLTSPHGPSHRSHHGLSDALRLRESEPVMPQNLPTPTAAN